ncbi:unnamed protein product [Amoebophrya sp. A25]|nr:unnamed protein product [Amoebophrya sp. A25]|eukprot:GSA25T00025543001.1
MLDTDDGGDERLYDRNWSCETCGGKTLCPSGVRFRKKMWTLGRLRKRGPWLEEKDIESNPQTGAVELSDVVDRKLDDDASTLDICMRLDKNATIPCLEFVFLSKQVERHRRKQQNEAAGYLLFQVLLEEDDNDTVIPPSAGTDRSQHDVENDPACPVSAGTDPSQQDERSTNITREESISTGTRKKKNSTGTRNSTIRDTHVTEESALVKVRKLAGFSLRGLRISPALRRGGIGAKLVRAWLEFCAFTRSPSIVTNKMDKPVLSLALQRAGMQPIRDNVSVLVLKPRSLEERREWEDFCHATDREKSSPAGGDMDAFAKAFCPKDTQQLPAPLMSDDEITIPVATPVSPDAQKEEDLGTSKRRKKAIADKIDSKPKYTYVNKDTVFLYSENRQQAKSVFAGSYLKTQNMVLFSPEWRPDDFDLMNIEMNNRTQLDDSDLNTEMNTTQSRADGRCSEGSINPETTANTKSGIMPASRGRRAFVNTPFYYDQEDAAAGTTWKGDRVVEWNQFCGHCFRTQILQVLEAWLKKTDSSPHQPLNVS